MKLQSNILDLTEKNTLALVQLYSAYGYTQYKMGKFEEYDLYSKNKGFLVDENIITFTDTNGKLMALKPDVTLSIVKNSDKQTQSVQKHYYNESVYRVSKSTGSFKEITQVGLECFGNVDAYLISEVLLLAAKSLEVFGKAFVLEVSHIGIVSALIEAITTDTALQKSFLKCVNHKNAHSITQLCRENGLDESKAEPLIRLISLSGTYQTVLAELEGVLQAFSLETQLEELRNALSVFDGSPLQDNIRIDFSAVGNIRYYNGIIFNGFVAGVPESVLSGGRYDALMARMKKDARAIGFAVYMDLLERLEQQADAFDVDVMLLYDASASPKEIAEAVASLQAQGKSVYAAASRDKKRRAKQIYYLEKGRLKAGENNA